MNTAKKLLSGAIAFTLAMGALSTSLPLIGSTTVYAAETKDAAKVTASSIIVAVGMSKPIPVSGSGSELSWSCRSSKAEISADGIITGKRIGNTTITAVNADGEEFTVKVTVRRVDIELDKTSLNVGSSTKIKVNCADDKLGSYTWYTSDENVAAIKDGTVTAKGSGSAKVGIKTADGTLYTAKIQVKTPKLSAPAVSATATSFDTISVSWNKQDGASFYEVYFSESKNGNYTLASKVTKTNRYTCSGLKNQTKYYFKVKACNDEKKSKFSKIAYAVTAKPSYSKERLEKLIKESESKISEYKSLEALYKQKVNEVKPQYEECKRMRDSWRVKLNKAKTQRVCREYNAETGQFEYTTDKAQIAYCQEYYDSYDELVKGYEEIINKYDYSQKIASVKSQIENYKKILKSYN